MSVSQEDIKEEIRRTYPYMDKKCDICRWALPDMGSEDDWCDYHKKAVSPQQAACDCFINYYAHVWL